MPELIMTRKAADNEYLHRDFHGALNIALEYLRREFGRGAARDYLRRFALSFYAPIKRDIRRRGLGALKRRLEAIYAAEGGAIRLRGNRDELRAEVDFCPAVRHITKMGLKVSPLFVETERAVYEAICENTPFAFELLRYDKKTGRSVLRFSRRKKR